MQTELEVGLKGENRTTYDMNKKYQEYDDPRKWLERARSNLLLAKTNPEDVFLEDLCFEAQQTAEKATKHS